jgi:hypothetical protein
MKPSLPIGILLLLTGSFGVIPARAQSIIDHLQSQTRPYDGIIRIECDPEVSALIGKPDASSEMYEGYDLPERQGYRIQVLFVDNDASKARSEATAGQSSIRNAFPEFPAYLLYEAPNWRLVVGNFLTLEEANLAKRRLQREFPQFGKEMYIISDTIRFSPAKR